MLLDVTFALSHSDDVCISNGNTISRGASSAAKGLSQTSATASSTVANSLPATSSAAAMGLTSGPTPVHTTQLQGASTPLPLHSASARVPTFDEEDTDSLASAVQFFVNRGAPKDAGVTFTSYSDGRKVIALTEVDSDTAQTFGMRLVREARNNPNKAGIATDDTFDGSNHSGALVAPPEGLTVLPAVLVAVFWTALLLQISLLLYLAPLC